MTRTGGCACGAIRFALNAEPLGVGICHCTSCQKLSGGGPNFVALMPRGSLTVTQGSPARWRSQGDSGAEVARAFCPDCGTPLWSEPAHEPFLPVKLGALDDTAGLTPQMRIFTASAPEWHMIDPGLPAFPAMPPRPGA